MDLDSWILGFLIFGGQQTLKIPSHRNAFEVAQASLDAASRASSDAADKMATKYGGEVDVWSCGVIAAELLLGRHPWQFTSEDWPTVFAAIAAKLGRPSGAKVPLMVGVGAQEMVAGGMWKDDAAARRS